MLGDVITIVLSRKLLRQYEPKRGDGTRRSVLVAPSAERSKELSCHFAVERRSQFGSLGLRSRWPRAQCAAGVWEATGDNAMQCSKAKPIVNNRHTGAAYAFRSRRATGGGWGISWEKTTPWHT